MSRRAQRRRRRRGAPVEQPTGLERHDPLGPKDAAHLPGRGIEAVDLADLPHQPPRVGLLDELHGPRDVQAERLLDENVESAPQALRGYLKIHGGGHYDRHRVDPGLQLTEIRDGWQS